MKQHQILILFKKNKQNSKNKERNLVKNENLEKKILENTHSYFYSSYLFYSYYYVNRLSADYIALSLIFSILSYKNYFSYSSDSQDV